MTYGTVNADVITTSTAGGVLGAGNASIMKNRIINGAMVIDQRNAGASVTPTHDSFTIDRYKWALSQASKLTTQQSTTTAVGFANSMLVTSTAATTVGSSDYFFFRQEIEGFNTADLNWGTANAKTVTLSFWVRSSLTGTFGGSLRNSAGDRSYPFSYTISSANTFEYKSVTIAGDTSGTWLTTNGIGISCSFGLGVGLSFSGTAGSWQASNLFSCTGATNVVSTNGATFYITGVQLEVGSSATGFEYVNYQTSLANCQRYYEKSYNIDVAPATTTDTGRLDFSGTSEGNGNVITKVIYKVTKRTNPTMTGYVGGGTSGIWTYEKSGASGTSTVTFDVIGNSSCRVYVPISANWTAGYIYGQWIASAEL